MGQIMTALREFSFVSVVFRLCLAACGGGLIGYGRTKKARTAGLRTHMITGIGAALTTLLAIYEYQMMCGMWADTVAQVGLKFDGSRFSAQVISGVGFLAAGSIIAVSHQQVEGLTTATGLFASVCMGIAAGAGFYECVFAAVILIILVLEVMLPLEARFKRRTRNITFTASFDQIENIDVILDVIHSKNAEIHGIDVEQYEKEGDTYPSAIFSLRLSKDGASHSDMLSSIAELDCVYSIEELIA